VFPGTTSALPDIPAEPATRRHHLASPLPQPRTRFPIGAIRSQSVNPWGQGDGLEWVLPDHVQALFFQKPTSARRQSGGLRRASIRRLSFESLASLTFDTSSQRNGRISVGTSVSSSIRPISRL